MSPLRLGRAEGNECPICHYEAKPRFTDFPILKKKLKEHWEKDHALRTLWAWNLEFYARTRAVIFLLGVMALGVAFSVLFQTAPFVVMGLAIYFALMAFYEVFRLQKKKKEEKR